MLGDRLGELERTGLVRRRRLDPPAASWVYELTPYGADLEPLMCALGRWGARSPGHRPDLPLSPTSFVLSLRTNVDLGRAAGPVATYALVVGGVALQARVGDGAFTVEPGRPEAPVASLSGTPEALAAVVYGGLDLTDADVVVEGDLGAARRLVGLFVLPEKAPVPTA